MDWQLVIAWGIFLAIVLLLLALDLFVLHRKPHAIQMKEALIGAMVPVVGALLFAVAIYLAYERHIFDLGVHPPGMNAAVEKYYPDTGGEASLLFMTGYVVELSLSADNVFLFVIFMNFFKVPRALQHRVLFWGVLGALVMRGIMIFLGTALLARFHWITYLFGLILLIAGAKMALSSGNSDPSKNIAVRAARKLFPIKEGFDGQKFFTRIDGKKVATTLFLVLICIEFSDLVFALDSIPAIFGITRDPFIVFTSNVFAILGLRSMYFLLAGVMDKFHLLKYGLAIVLAFVGVKMLLPGAAEIYSHATGQVVEWEIDKYVSLAVIVGVLALSVMASLVVPSRRHSHNPLAEEASETKATGV